MESNPIHLRRKQFFDARQKEGQTIIEFREELLSLIEEADGDNIGVHDLICMMMQIGASDPSLRRELGSIKNPTLITFNDKIEGYEQARKKKSSTAYGLAAKGAPQKRNQNTPSTKNAQRSTQNSGGNERSQRTALRGRCFKCATVKCDRQMQYMQ